MINWKKLYIDPLTTDNTIYRDSLILSKTESEITAKYEKRVKYLPILHDTNV